MTNRALRFQRGAGLQLAGNEKTQPGYLRLENVRIDLRDAIAKKSGSIEVGRTVAGDSIDTIPVADLRAIWYRGSEGELLLETVTGLYSARRCDVARVGVSLPDGDWDYRGPWTRGTLRNGITRDWGFASVVQSSAALVQAGAGGAPCRLQLADVRTGDDPGMYALVVGDVAEEQSSAIARGQATLLQADGKSPHVAHVRDNLLAYTFSSQAGALNYQFWAPGDAFAFALTGIAVQAPIARYDLTGVTPQGGVGYYGLIAVDAAANLQVEVRNESGVANVFPLVVAGALNPPSAVAIYGIPDQTTTDAIFAFAVVFIEAPGTTRLYVEVASYDGAALNTIWSNNGVQSNDGSPTRVTIGATVADYLSSVKVAVQEDVPSAGRYVRQSVVTPGVSITERVYRRNAIYAGMLERDGRIVFAMSAIDESGDRVRRTGIFLTEAADEFGPLPSLAPFPEETLSRVDFALVEMIDQEGARDQVSDLNEFSTTAALFGYQVETGVLDAVDPVPATVGLTATKTSWFDNTATPNRPADSQDVSVSAHAGYPRMYAGETPNEQDWHELPQILVAAEGDPGSIPAGDYTVAATFEAYDPQGNFYRSQPDFFGPFELTGPATIGINARTIQRTERPTVQQTFWRTLDGGTIFYKALTVDAKVATTLPADIITVTLTDDDVTVRAREQLDQVLGGTLPSQPTRITDFVLGADGRLFGPDPERLSLVRFSIPASEGRAPHWPLVQGLEVESSRAVTAGGAMDGRLVFWTRTEAHTVNGGGPSATGQGAYGIPRLIPSSIGCSGHPTVALTPDGLVYGSGFTPHILTRALVTQEYADSVYAPYEIDGEDVAVALWRPNERTTTLVNGPGERVFVLSPETLRWMEETGRVAIDIALSDDRSVAWLLEDGRILIEPSVPAGQTPGLDGVLGFQMLVSTPWIHWPTKDAITHTGFNFHGCQVYGTHQGAHEIQMRAYFDYETTPRYSLLKSEAQVTANDAAGLPYLYQWVLPMAERCFAVRIEWSDGSESAPTALIEGIDVELTTSGDSKPVTLDSRLYLPAVP